MSSEVLIPIYKAIKEEIIDNILSGVYHEGDLIPTQQFYSEKYGVSRIVVRRAIDELVTKGVLITNRGQGTRVGSITTKLFTPSHGSGLSRNMAIRNVLSSQLLNIQKETGSKKVTDSLNLPLNSDVLVIERIRRINNLPYSHELAYLDYRCVASVDFRPLELGGSLYALLKEALNLEAVFGDEWIRAVLCPQRLTQMLEMQNSDPLLYVRQLDYTADGTALNYSERHVKTDILDIHIRTDNRAI